VPIDVWRALSALYLVPKQHRAAHHGDGWAEGTFVEMDVRMRAGVEHGRAEEQL
jgi:hypothetical protein